MKGWLRVVVKWLARQVAEEVVEQIQQERAPFRPTPRRGPMEKVPK